MAGEKKPLAPGVWRTVLVLVLFIALCIAGFVNRILHPRVLTPVEMQVNGAVLLKTPRELSPFHLVDEQGRPFTNESLLGHWTLLYFGYTSCPDVCPTTLATLNRWYGILQKTRYAADTRVIMVTVDPARDTPAVLKPYVQYFNAGFSAVTGEFLDVHRLATEVNVAFQKVPGDTPDHYAVDHSSQLVLINPRGHYHAFFKPTDYAGVMPEFNPEHLLLTYKSIRAQW